MKKSRFAKHAALLIAMAMQIPFAMAADAQLDEAQRLVTAKKSAEAYELLLPLQSERAGDPAYDYLLGIAALDSGKTLEAVFALERFLMLNPDNGPARLELARAYYIMGDIKSSRREFETVKAQQIPTQVNAAIQNYLSAMNALVAGAGTRVRGYVELGGGHDSNANSATSATTVAIPAFGGLVGTLDPASRKQSDEFLMGGAGINVRHPFSPEWAFSANTALNLRRYSSLDQFNLGTLDGSAGFTRTRGVDQYTGAIQYQKLMIDSSSYRQTYGFLGQWQHSFDNQRQFTTYGQAMKLDYDGTQSIRTGNRYLIGAAYSQAFDGKYMPVGYAGAYVGKERPDANSVPHLGHNFYGIRSGGQISLASNLGIVGSASIEKRDYRGEEPGFLRTRDDKQMDLSLALVYLPKTDWVIRPEISHIRNKSNVVFNDFSRTQIFVTVRRNFN
ncbi:surface lipoprotein assembly modifier [Oxalicibacterium faecigallinarum]|uniref:surface lipoprotein assembly modifier n=1 Tax=Oxalicibacterium faecigallinarum TaxID=573741 RepID=UPI00280ACC88|nr:surface lipoprotein assembly modifier [Oxalicibacterium faecigallinarum]